ncbi:hypothetical protein EDB89DRAFT_1069135 [Lactarius sanguifluus]|nr:hypothetical protein EDB89DRAFT_1069135 [Lactarius sanguifluus]
MQRLPDNALLEIFDFYRKTDETYHPQAGWKWDPLTHVCQRWRQVVFASPNRLNLQIICMYGTPVRKNLGIWPAFPIVINYKRGIMPIDEDNVIAALEHHDRVCYLGLYVTGSQLRKMATAMQEPFPVLTCLHVGSKDSDAPVLPVEFLGGSAPRLQEIQLQGIPFPALPTLLLSASDLVDLRLYKIPPTGYISPEDIVASLATLPRLGLFFIGFRSATSRPQADRIPPPPRTRTVLPTLFNLQFHGASSEYIEDLVGRIDCPQLDIFSTFYLNQFVDFQVAQLSGFIDRSLGPKIAPLRHASIRFYGGSVCFSTDLPLNDPDWDMGPVLISISCQGIDRQVSHMAQVLSQIPATLSNLVHLKLDHEREEDELEVTDNVEWLLLFLQLSAVRTLHVSPKLVKHVALALGDIAGDMVMPSLDLICLEERPVSSVEKFVATRRLSGRLVTVVNDTEEVFDKRLESYVSE